MTTSAILDSLQRSIDHRLDISRQQGQALRQVTVPTPMTRAVPANRTPAVTARRSEPTITFRLVDELAAQLPPAKYALPNTGTGAIDFFEVAKYKGGMRVRRLFGAPRDWRRETMNLRMQCFAIKHILEDVPNAIKLFGDTFKVCSKCGSPLSNGKSLAAKLGPDCRKAFARWI
jgi:hypothetical protein